MFGALLWAFFALLALPDRALPPSGNFPLAYVQASPSTSPPCGSLSHQIQAAFQGTRLLTMLNLAVQVRIPREEARLKVSPCSKEIS